ncbi:MAG: PEGA domain-containing protein [Planctomycetes bacterium]|nr:PEGA domain-containing protein [Planctomycetota bacterium]
MTWRRLWVILAAIGVGCVVGLTWVMPKVRQITVTSEPDGATVYLDTEYVGATPVTLSGVRRGPKVIKVTKHDYLPWSHTCTPRLGHLTVHAVLQPRPRGDLKLTSSPSNAKVSVDGEAKGETPLVVRGLDPGPHEVRLTRDGYSPWEETVTVANGQVVERNLALKSLTAEYYLAAIQKSPAQLYNYIELGHYYALQHRFKDAADILAKALVVASGPSADPEIVPRLFQELNNIHEPLFDYGDETVVKQARPFIEAILENEIKRRPSDWRSRATLAAAYDRVDKRKEALEHIEKAAQMCTDEQWSRRIQALYRKLRGY